MRASYRWGALGVFGAWLLIVFALSASKGRRNKGFMMAMLLLITFFNLPHPGKNWLSKEQNRAMFFQLDTDILEHSVLMFHQGRWSYFCHGETISWLIILRQS
jgi:hypothetical protein